MRKLFLLVVALLGVLVVGCENLFPTEQSPNATPIFETDSEGSYTVKAEGKEIDILVTTNIDYSVVIPTDAQEWLSAVCTRSDAREEILAFVVAPNDSFEERSTRAELVDANGKVLESISFIQEGQSKVFRVDGNGNYVVTGLGGNVEVVVTTNLEYSVVIQKGAQSWLSVADTRADVRRETLTFIVAENEAYETRTATVELVGDDNQVLQKISIIQEEKVDTFIMTGENNYLVVAEGGEVNVVLITNLDYSVVIEKDAQAWLSVADTRALRVDELTFVVAPNTTYEERTTTVELVDDKNKVLQEISFTQNAAAQSGSVCPNNEIWYTTTDGNVLVLNNNAEFNVSVVSNTYINGKGVIRFDGDLTEIGVKSFYNCSTLSTVHLPKSLKKSGHLAFEECWNLTGVYIYDLAAWCNIDFENLATDTIYLDANPLCYARDLYLNGELVTDLVIPEGVSEVKLIAFVGCNSITSVTIPDSVTSIDSCAFYECENLAKVTIGDSVTTIGDYAFCECVNLTKVTFGDGLNTIGDYAFVNCKILANLNIPNSVTTIGMYVFTGCESITSVTIPESVTSIGTAAFNYCHSLTNVYCKSLTPPSAVVSLDGSWYAFAGSRAISIYVPMESVDIYKSAEFWCEYADSIFIYELENDEVVTDVPNNEIWYTNGSVTTPTYPYNIDAFDANIVSNYYDPEYKYWRIQFDRDVTTIGYYAFRDGQNLTKVIIGNSVTKIGSYAFENCSHLKSINIPNSVTEIGYGAFHFCQHLLNVTIPNSVSIIGDCAFRYCNSLTEFKGKFASEDGKCLIVDGTLKAFAIGCGATEYTIPDNVTTIGHYAFESCYSLASITIPDSVTTIGYGAFRSCRLSKVSIPNSVTIIGESAFCGNGVKEFCGKFASDGGKCLIVDNTLIAYADGCVDTEYTIPTGVTKIGDEVFSNCYNLINVTIPNSVITIGTYAFQSCTSLTSVTIPDSVTSIGLGAFAHCLSLMSVAIPDTVTTIGDCAFWQCIDLTSITIPASVTTIGYGAFDYCSNLTSVYCKRPIPSSVTLNYNGYWGAFDYNASGRKIYVPTESVEAYKSTASWSDYADAIVGYNF